MADAAAMGQMLQGWIGDRDLTGLPLGRWAVETSSTATSVSAVSLLPLPPGRTDLEIGWQVSSEAWGYGFGTEAGHAVAHQAFQEGVNEVLAVVRPGNTRGIATAKRVGTEGVGETNKYYDLTLQVYRLKAGDLDHPGPLTGQILGR